MNEIIEVHTQHYQSPPSVVTKAPGVIRLFSTLWGEVRGRVLAGAVNLYASVSLSLRSDDEIRVYHHTRNESRSCSVKNLKYKKEDDWLNYVKGVLSELDKLGCPLKGMDISLLSKIPKSLGLNSSTALCVALALAVRALFRFELDDIQLLQAAYLAEYSFMEIKTALLVDALACYYVKPDHLVYYDSHSVDFIQYDISAFAHSFFLVDSGVKQVWNRAEFASLLQFTKEFQALLDRQKVLVLLNIDDLAFSASDFTSKSLGEAMRLMTHMVFEKQRIEESRSFIEGNKMESLGKLLNDSHLSLNENLNLQAVEVDWLHKWIAQMPGVLGSRLVGLGKGGCLLVLSASDRFDLDTEGRTQYTQTFGHRVRVFPVRFDGRVTLNTFQH